MPSRSGVVPARSETVGVSQCPHCGQSVAESVSTGYCERCGEAWLRCSGCRAAVSSLWKYCPFHEKHEIQPWHPSEIPREIAKTPIEVQLTDEKYLSAPQAYAGYLWTLSDNGNLHRFSPTLEGFKRKTLEDLGLGYGAHPFCVLRGSGNRRTLLAAMGTRGLCILDPAFHDQEIDEPPPMRPTLRPNENFIYSEDCLTAVSLWKDNFACLKRKRSPEEMRARCEGRPRNGELSQERERQQEREGEFFLCLARLIKGGPNGPGAVEVFAEYQLEGERISGPFVLRENSEEFVCVYSDAQIFWLAGTELRKKTLPAGIHPILRPGDQANIRLPWGRPAFVVNATSRMAYLPATIFNTPGFLCVQMAFGEPKLSQFDCPTDCSYRSDPWARLIVVGQGKIRSVEGPGFSVRPIREDPQIVAGPAIAEKAIQAALCKAAGADHRLRLRVYLGDQPGMDLDPVLDENLVPLDLFLFPGWIVLTSLLERYTRTMDREITETNLLDLRAWALH